MRMHKVGKNGQFNTRDGQLEFQLKRTSRNWAKPLAFALCCCISISLFGQGRISFSKTYFYFGNIKEEGGPATKDFPFVNKGRSPLLVEQVKTTCGCTVSSFDRDSIMPGDTGHVRITFDPRGRPGLFRKTATVLTNGSPKSVTLTISGQVRPRPKGPRDYYPFKEGNMRLKTNHLTFHKMLDNARKTLTTVLYNAGTDTISIDLPDSQIPDYLGVRISRTALSPGDTAKMWVKYDAGKRADWGVLFDTFYLNTNDSERPMKRLSASAHVRQHFPKGGQKAKLVVNTKELDFGTIEEGEIVGETIEVKNTGSKDLLIRKIASQCSCLEFKWSEEPISPGESVPVLVLFNTRGRVGKIEKEFTLISNSPTNPELVFPVKVEIVSKK